MGGNDAELCMCVYLFTSAHVLLPVVSLRSPLSPVSARVMISLAFTFALWQRHTAMTGNHVNWDDFSIQKL